MTKQSTTLQEHARSLSGSIKRAAKPAFTIVELLIVVVVIAILAVITIVAYNGITNQAKDSSLKADLNTTAKKVGLVNAETGSYPSTKPSDIPSYIQYSQTNAGQGFCATASKDGKAFNVTQDGTVREGACSGHTVISGGSGNGGTEIANNTPIQSVTQAQCQALPVYTGSNPTAIRTLTDSRGGTIRTYEVAKLTDNKCWMLTNLKLGSTSGTITLTPADSNVTTNFTLPQVGTTGSTSSGTEAGNGYDTPYAYGPVPGDTGSGATNYGYLYNWPAATAGATRTSNPANSGNAANSICPANWRLPTGASTGEFAMLNAKMNNPDAATSSTSSGTGYYQNWQNPGPFKGVFSGGWWGSFLDQGSSSILWSSSAHASDANIAHDAYFDASLVYPDFIVGRYYGLGVRCLLN